MYVPKNILEKVAFIWFLGMVLIMEPKGICCGDSSILGFCHLLVQSLNCVVQTALKLKIL